MKTFAFPLPPTEMPAPTTEDGHEALVRVQAQLPQVDITGAVVSINIPKACAIALGALPAIHRLRPRMVRELPLMPLAEVDALEDRTLAVYYAHTLCMPRPRSDQDLQAAYEEGRLLREELLQSAEILARKGHLDPHRVAGIRRGRGWFDLAEDLVALSLLYRQAWSPVSSKCVVTQADCERADALGRQLLRMLGDRMQPAAEGMTMDQARDQRLRCYVLFLGAYDWCRRAAGYLRWPEDDADTFVPTLHPRGGRRAARRGHPSPSVDADAEEGRERAPGEVAAATGRRDA